MLTSGAERFKSDIRQISALLLVLGICATFGALADIVSHVGPKGSTSSQGLPLAALFSAIAQAFFGIFAMATGYSQLLLDAGNKYLTAALIVATQMAFMPYITTLSNIVKTTKTGEAFIPPAYSPTNTDIRFFGAMGFLAVLVHGFAYIGSLAFMEFSLFAYQNNKPQDRTASYFRNRSVLYNILLFVAGMTQAALGAYTIANIGGGPLEKGAVGVAMYTIFFPEISVVVGLIQIIVAVYGVVRALNIMVVRSSDNSMQIMTFFMWLCMLSMQIVTQVGYAPAGAMAAAAPSRACVTFGIAFMPAYLDAKMRLTPEEFSPDYYSLEDEKKEGIPSEDDDDMA